MGKTKTAFVSDIEANKKIENKKKARKETKIHISGLKGGQRIKTIEAETLPTEQTTPEETDKKAKFKKAHQRGKKWKEVKAKIDHGKNYPLKEAIKLVKETSYSKFDGTMEVHLMVKKTGTSVNITLPFSAGKEKKVEIASDETIDKLKNGKVDFDVLVATPEVMPKLVPFARILGPKGLMPNPKNGTLVTSIEKAKKVSGSQKTLKTEKEAPLIHTSFGKVSQKDEELVTNLEAIIKALGGAKQIISCFIKSTMSPSVQVQL